MSPKLFIPSPFARRLLAAFRLEHLLLALFTVWAARMVPGWYRHFGDALINTNRVGLSWVAAPAAILIGIITAQKVAAWLLSGRGESLGIASRGLLAKLALLLADWLPFFLFLSIYLMFRSRLMQFYQGENCDFELAWWEERIFGGHLSLWMERFTSVPLTLTMQIFYNAHIYFTTPFAAVLCYLKDRNLFRALMLAFTLVAVIGAVGYSKLPGAGPGRFLHDQFKGDLPTTRLGQALNYSIETARAPDDVFPSLHVAISLLCLMAVFRTWRWAFWLILPFILGNWVSTVYLRYHYVIDCVAGAGLAVAAFYLAHGTVALEKRLKEAVPPPVTESSGAGLPGLDHLT